MAGIARSTYYYTLKQMNQPEKHTSLKEIIREIFLENKRRYGYRRITMELHQRGISANHKLVQKIMRQCNLFCVRRKSKYKSYKANADLHYQKMVQENPELNSTFLSRMAQKWKIKREYAKQAREAARQTAKAAGAAATTTEKAAAYSVSRETILTL